MENSAMQNKTQEAPAIFKILNGIANELGFSFLPTDTEDEAGEKFARIVEDLSVAVIYACTLAAQEGRNIEKICVRHISKAEKDLMETLKEIQATAGIVPCPTQNH